MTTTVGAAAGGAAAREARAGRAATREALAAGAAAGASATGEAATCGAATRAAASCPAAGNWANMATWGLGRRGHAHADRHGLAVVADQDRAATSVQCAQ